MKNWMAELASHYEESRRRYPNDRLMILFDIDGTIVDTRYIVLELLRTYDRQHNTRLFRDMTVSDIKTPENRVATVVANLPFSPEDREAILRWYEGDRWSSVGVLESHCPFVGVLEVIRWFQIQPNCYVALNTGRTERMRDRTLYSLNELGKEYRVSFTHDLLWMRPSSDWGVEDAKVAGVRHFQRLGYRVVAFIDNEPSNLEAIAEIDPEHRILLLHADTIFESKRTRLPPRTVGGDVYDLTELIAENALPQHIQFVWRIADGVASLKQFLAAEIHRVQSDVYLEPIYGDLLLHKGAPKGAQLHGSSEGLTPDHLLASLSEAGKCVCLELKTGGVLVERVLELLDAYGFDDSQLCFSGGVEHLQEQGFRALASAYSGAALQCPIDFLAPLIVSAPEKAREIVDMLTTWGISRFSIDWQTPDIRRFFDQMDQWGFEVNIHNVPDLESFLQAVLLMPHSITSDFDFPRWHRNNAAESESVRNRQLVAPESWEEQK